MGRPRSACRSPAARARSACFAASMARSGVRTGIALSTPSCFSIHARWSSTSSTALTCLASSASSISIAVLNGPMSVAMARTLRAVAAALPSELTSIANRIAPRLKERRGDGRGRGRIGGRIDLLGLVVSAGSVGVLRRWCGRVHACREPGLDGGSGRCAGRDAWRDRGVRGVPRGARRP